MVPGPRVTGLPPVPVLKVWVQDCGRPPPTLLHPASHHSHPQHLTTNGSIIRELTSDSNTAAWRRCHTSRATWDPRTCGTYGGLGWCMGVDDSFWLLPTDQRGCVSTGIFAHNTLAAPASSTPDHRRRLESAPIHIPHHHRRRSSGERAHSKETPSRAWRVAIEPP